MKLNTLKPGDGSRKAPKRPGRGIGSGLGKTGGRGHKGQKSRSGGYHKIGFEGGQMPLQRRLPKRGFRSRKGALSAELALSTLAKVDPSVDVVDMAALKAAHLVPQQAKKVKVIVSGGIDRAVVLRGINCTKGALAAIEAAGGRVETESVSEPASGSSGPAGGPDASADASGDQSE